MGKYSGANDVSTVSTPQKPKRFLTISNRQHEEYTQIHLVAAYKPTILAGLLKELLAWKLGIVEGGLVAANAHVWCTLLVQDSSVGGKVANRLVPEIISALRSLTSKSKAGDETASPHSPLLSAKLFKNIDINKGDANGNPQTCVVEAVQSDGSKSQSFSIIKMATSGALSLLTSAVDYVCGAVNILNAHVGEKGGVLFAVLFVQDKFADHQIDRRKLDLIASDVTEILSSQEQEGGGNAKGVQTSLNTALRAAATKATEQWGKRASLMDGSATSVLSHEALPTKAAGQPLTSKEIQAMIKTAKSPPSPLPPLDINPSTPSATHSAASTPAITKTPSPKPTPSQSATPPEPTPTRKQKGSFISRLSEALGFGRSIIKNTAKPKPVEKVVVEKAKAPPQPTDGHAWFTLPVVKSGGALSMEQFELVAKLGHGMTANVYLAKLREAPARLNPNDNLVALKVMPKKLVVDCGRRVGELMVAERTVTTHMQGCPFILRMFGYFQDQYALYVVMETASCDFFQLMSNYYGDSIYWRSIKIWAAQVLLALEHIHKKGHLYRDLKPENMLIRPDGSVCLADFGLSIALADCKDNRAFSICGTVEYMCPEMVMQKGYSYPSELWAFGILIYEMIAGTTPFEGAENSQAVLRKIKEFRGRLVFPEDVTVEPSARQIILGLLSLDPATRLGAKDNVGSYNSIKKHPWFAGVDWDAVREGRIRPALKVPFKVQENSRFTVPKGGKFPWEKGNIVSDEYHTKLFENF